MQLDVTSDDSAAAVIDWLRSDFGGLDLLVNSAGYMSSGDLGAPCAATTSGNELDTNLGGPIRMTRLALPLLRQAPEAGIVYISSAVALTAVPQLSVYAAAKAGLHSFARSTRAGLTDTNIHIFEILPPLVDTDLASEIDARKIAPSAVADAIIHGITHNRQQIAIAAVRPLVPLARLAPRLADRLVQRALQPSPSQERPITASATNDRAVRPMTMPSASNRARRPLNSGRLDRWGAAVRGEAEVRAVDRSLPLWHQMIHQHDLSQLPSIVHPDAVFHSPIAVLPYTTREPLVLAVNTLTTVLEDFSYQHTDQTADGNDIALEFTARVGDNALKGTHLIHFGDDGLIRDFEVMIRPLSALHAVATAMAAQLGNQRSAFTQPTNDTSRAAQGASRS